MKQIVANRPTRHSTVETKIFARGSYVRRKGSYKDFSNRTITLAPFRLLFGCVLVFSVFWFSFYQELDDAATEVKTASLREEVHDRFLLDFIAGFKLPLG